MTLLVIFWIICIIFAGYIGSKKGEGGSAVFCAIFLGPIAVIMAMCSKGKRKTCPHCKELIHKDASVCPHCQREVYLY